MQTLTNAKANAPMHNHLQNTCSCRLPHHVHLHLDVIRLVAAYASQLNIQQLVYNR